MPTEIERKFLVKGDFMPFVVKQYTITQGFLSIVPERTIRVRIKDNQGFLTVKGLSNVEGTERFEWEQEINVNDAEHLLEICEPYPIFKTRFIVLANDDLKFEIDVFYKENNGLIVAEIELEDSDQPFEKPDWLGKEITGDIKYYNSNLAKKPFKFW